MEVGIQYTHVLEEIDQSAQACGRNPQSITLVAVSKTYEWPHIAPAYAAGCRDFGESRVQEALLKMEQAPQDIRWHMIGTLQKNKVHKVIGRFTLIHGVDSVELAKKISHSSLEAGLVTSILLQVNETQETTKYGLTSEAWKPHLEELQKLEGICIKGLMTIGPLTEDQTQIRQCFAKVRNTKESFAKEFKDPSLFTELSMGMSHDFPIAIAEGATIVRIGTSIFGER